MNDHRARELVAQERTRLEALLADADDEIRSDGSLRQQQPGESADGGSSLNTASTDLSQAAALRERLASVGRAEERISAGTYGRSVESGIAIPDARLEAEPLAERSIDEQRRVERGESGQDQRPV